MQVPYLFKREFAVKSSESLCLKFQENTFFSFQKYLKMLANIAEKTRDIIIEAIIISHYFIQ